MSYTFTNVVSAGVDFNTSYAYNNSWVKVDNNANRELYAQGVYITNLQDFPINLQASDISIGSVEINDPTNVALKASVASIGPGTAALRVLTQDLEPAEDTVSLADINSNNVGVHSSLSALKVYITGGEVITEAKAGSLYSFNNHGITLHKGFTLREDTVTPVVSIRMKPGTTVNDVAELEEYEIGSNNAANSTVVYEWYEGNVSITGPALPSWTDLGTKLQYRYYTDWNGSQIGHTFSANGAVMRHSGIVIGKNSSADEGGVDLVGGTSPTVLTLCMKRVDSSSKIDLWSAFTLKEL